MAADVRERLLGESVGFIRAVRRTPGIRSIAVVGSITTPKSAPKDIDFLLAVDDDADLAVLAMHSRRLQGRLQGFNLSVDTFLADGRGQYLGRVFSGASADLANGRPVMPGTADDVHTCMTISVR